MKKETLELFVSYRYGDDFYEVFTTLKEAEKATTENNKSLAKNKKVFSYLSHSLPYKAMSLSEAIEEIKDYVRDTTEYNIRYPEE